MAATTLAKSRQERSHLQSRLSRNPVITDCAYDIEISHLDNCNNCVTS
jgi:hypothetical protein